MTFASRDICTDCGRPFLGRGALLMHQNEEHGARHPIVYIDDMYRTSMGNFGRMKMSHMFSEDEEALHAMAKAIGMRREWYQGDHYDVAIAKREQAIERGAISVPLRTAGLMMSNHRAGWPMGTPDFAETIWNARREDSKAHDSAFALRPSWWKIAPPAPDAVNAAQYCRKIGTSQCAAICLSWWPAGKPGECPHALAVWGKKEPPPKPKPKARKKRAKE